MNARVGAVDAVDAAGSTSAVVISGVRDAAPVALAYVPFGIALGAGLRATGAAPGIAWSSSPLLFGGAAQLVALQLLSAGAASAVVVLTALVINARMLLYSAALAPAISRWGRGSRCAAAYLLADPVYALAHRRLTEPHPAAAGPDSTVAGGIDRRYYFGMAGTLWVAWQLLTATGLVLGGLVPASWHLERAAPLTFLLLLLPMLGTGSARVAAAVAGGIAVVTCRLPLGLGLLVGALAGVAGVAALGSRARGEERSHA